MAEDLYQYAAALLDHWWTIVTGGTLVLADNLAHTYIAWWRTFTDRGGPWRRRLEIAFVLGAIAWAGFQAWQDEHHTVLSQQAEKSRQFGRAEYWRGIAAAQQQSIEDLKGRPQQVVVQTTSAGAPALAAQPSRDPDTFYQDDRPVGLVEDVRIDFPSGTITFGSVSETGQLDRTRPFKYRNYTLQFVGYSSSFTIDASTSRSRRDVLTVVRTKILKR